MSPAARSRSTDRRYYGVVEAIVEESAGDDEGRVKVKFPWFDGSTVTDWCRVAQLYAGNGYGAIFVPEKGDEVAVSFVHGDMRFPVILGGLYNGKDKPPAAPVNGKDVKTIRTKAGHELTFDDESGQAAVRVVSAAGHTMELDDQGTSVSLRTAGGDSLTIDQNGIMLKTSGDITLQAGGKITLDSSSVVLGNGPVQQAALLEGFQTQTFATHTHTSSPTGGPTTPPVPLPPSPSAKTQQVTAS